VLALGLLAVSALADRSSPVVSAPSFYRPPASAPDHPGVLVRTQPMTQGIPSTARAWRILYTTTRRHGRPALASGIVVESRHVSSGPRPVIAWAHATTGFAHGCAPSLMKEPFAPGSMPALQQVLDHGWIVVATDYTGLGTSGAEPYLVGQLEARAVLDSVRAVRGGMKQVHLANRTVVWGHSQGGGAALWAGILAPHYAPSADVIGVVALSPMTELPEIVNGARETPVGKLVGSYLLSAYSATYPDVKLADYVPPAAQKAVIRTAGRCVAGPQQLASAASAAPSGPIFSASPATGALGKRLTQNIPVGHIHAPLLIVQGLSDTLVRPQYQLQYINRECAIHQRLEYHTYKGFDHVSLLLDPHSPMVNDLLNWTEDRLQRAEQPPGCHTQSS
jgi:alpha-beta hydrolase superfamily lysophospholipase